MLEETDRLFGCSFCRVNSYLQTRGHFRYVLPSNAPPDKEILYFPYWRLKGMLFSCSPDKIAHRIIDVSHQAVESDAFPASVGLRSQALKLRFVAPDIPGNFMRTTLPFEKVKSLVEERFSSYFPKPVIHQVYVGDALSLIYAPHYLDRKLYDAVLNEPISDTLTDDFVASAFQEGAANASLRFLATLCPNCGWDLKGERDSLVLHCENCSSVWKAEEKGFARLSASHMPAREEKVVYLPFWRIKAQLKGIELDSYADLVRAANLPKALRQGMENIRFHFWSLAFKVRPESFLKLTRTITLSQPTEKLAPGVPDGAKHPVTLSLREAVDSLKLTLASFLKPRRKMMGILPGIDITPRSFILVYLPFQERRQELVQPEFTMTINKNLLHHARNL